jgi:catalase
VQTLKPIPTSLARESFFAVSAMRFTGNNGKSRFGRYQMLPAADNEYLTADEAARQPPNFLMDELTQQIKKGPVEFRIVVQLASEGDEVNDATVVWPEARERVEFGTVTLTERVNELDPEIRKIIFDPRPGVDGIEASSDPLFEVRAALYLMSGRRRRAATKSV